MALFIAIIWHGMKHKTTHISWLIICIIIAVMAFIGGMLYGEKTEKKRIQEGFLRVFQQEFGSMGTGSSAVEAQDALSDDVE